MGVLYLIDSIVKNVGGNSVKLFQDKLVNAFEDTFRSNNTTTRTKLYKLRQSWSNTASVSPIFTRNVLIRLDRRVNMMDPGWPIDGKPPTIPPPRTTPVENNSSPSTQKILINPNFLNKDKIKSENGTSDIDLEVARKNAKQKEELEEKKCELEDLKDDISEMMEEKQKINQQMAACKVAAEKKLLRKKILELNKKLINTEPKKLELEKKIEMLESGKTVAVSKPIPKPVAPKAPVTKPKVTKPATAPVDPRKPKITPTQAPVTQKQADPVPGKVKKKSDNKNRNNEAADNLR